MSTCRLRVLVGRRGALLTHSNDSVTDTFDDGGDGQGQRAASLGCRGDILGDECWRRYMHLRFPKNIRSSRRHGVVEQNLQVCTG